MWAGEQWELVGKGVALLIPVLLVGGAVVGSFAANTYNQGAEYVQTTTSNVQLLICSLSVTSV